MADFCKQCSIANFGEDFEDLKITEPLPEGKYYAALCEGCGYIQVDNDGLCVTENCLEKHGKKKGG